jgi:hypothetical protein
MFICCRTVTACSRLKNKTRQITANRHRPHWLLVGGGRTPAGARVDLESGMVGLQQRATNSFNAPSSCAMIANRAKRHAVPLIVI